jgi:LAS superfamily LD-carboxypeptidase LdcB
MKHIFTILAFVAMLLSCNSGDKKISLIKTTEIALDTIKTVDQLNFNITKDFVLGKFDYKSDSTFLKIIPPYASKELYLNIQVANVFLDMYNAAEADGIELKIISGTRNFKEQKVIWERKWKEHQNLEPLQRALKILEYSAMPSSSRHHWGTDIDLNSLNNSYFHSGKGLAVYEWLKTYANGFGFYQVYTEKDLNRTGYNLEKWHWSYLPLASQYLEFYNKRIINDDINGFSGFEQAQNLMIIKDYVNGISRKAKDYK